MGLGRNSSRVANRRLQNYNEDRLASMYDPEMDLSGFANDPDLLDSHSNGSFPFLEEESSESDKDEPFVLTKGSRNPAGSHNLALVTTGGVARPPHRKSKGRPRKHAPKEVLEALKAQTGSEQIRSFLESVCYLSLLFHSFEQSPRTFH